MTAYVIRELQNAQSYREGETIQANSLTIAKRKATRDQYFQDTVLTIESVQTGLVLSTKTDGQWNDIFFPPT